MGFMKKSASRTEFLLLVGIGVGRGVMRGGGPVCLSFYRETFLEGPLLPTLGL